MINYPVDVENSRFTFKLGALVLRRQKWPRHDGMQLEDANPELVILEESFAALPVYDPATHRLDNGAWTDDVQNQTAVFSRNVIPLTQAEIDFATKRNNLATSIATLRDWANQSRATTVTSGNAVTVLQTVVNRLGTFFDRFADLLEVR